MLWQRSSCAYLCVSMHMYHGHTVASTSWHLHSIGSFCWNILTLFTSFWTFFASQISMLRIGDTSLYLSLSSISNVYTRGTAFGR